MPPHPAPLPDHLGDEFSCRRAHSAGVSARRLRAQDLDAPHRGVRMKRDPEPEEPREQDEQEGDPDAPGAQDRAERRDLLRRARAYAEIMSPHAFFVGRTAAVICGVRTDATGDLEVAVIAPARAPRVAGVRARKVKRSFVFVREVEKLRVASVASTWAMLGAELSVRELVILGDAMVRVPRGPRGVKNVAKRLATIEELKRAVEAGRRRGSPRLRDALELIRVGSASTLETEYRLDAAAAGLPEPELDVEIRDESGRLLGISEVVHREFRIAVEIEGDHHRTSRAQWNRDIEKYAAYAAQGWEVVRLTSTHIRGRSPRGVKMVRGALVRRGWTGQTSAP